MHERAMMPKHSLCRKRAGVGSSTPMRESEPSYSSAYPALRDTSKAGRKPHRDSVPFYESNPYGGSVPLRRSIPCAESAPYPDSTPTPQKRAIVFKR